MTAAPAPDSTWSLGRWLSWQESLHPRPIELGLERVRAVAERLGLLAAGPPTITVGGTNGKGSTATLLAAALREQGYRAGLYTSPHLLRYNERIAIDGVAASDAAICRAFCAIEAARDGVSLSYFEFGTLAALWLFREARVEAQVLEVGLGGRLDAVNIVDADCAIVTNIGLDHLEWLGRDRDRIGVEKAGIFRRGRPAIVADPAPPEGLLRAAAAAGASLWRLGHEFEIGQPAAGEWCFELRGRPHWRLPPAALSGAAQRRNAAAALAALAALHDRLPVSAAALSRALCGLQLPGRFQRIGRYVLDVAHNAEAATELAANLRHSRGRGRSLLLIGMLDDKPVEAVASALAGCVDLAFAATLPPPRGLDGAALAARLAGLGVAVQSCASVAAALAAAQAAAAAEDRIVVTGSFLTVAAALERLRG